eukprot:438644-Rhodomonas_salina.1
MNSHSRAEDSQIVGHVELRVPIAENAVQNCNLRAHNTAPSEGGGRRRRAAGRGREGRQEGQ